MKEAIPIPQDGFAVRQAIAQQFASATDFEVPGLGVGVGGGVKPQAKGLGAPKNVSEPGLVWTMLKLQKMARSVVVMGCLWLDDLWLFHLKK